MLRRPIGRLVSLSIIAFWLVMMGLFLNREGLLSSLPGAQHLSSNRLLKQTDSWMGIYLGEARIGFVNVNTNPERRNGSLGAQIMVTSDLRLNVLDSPMRILIAGTAWIPVGDGKSEFDFKVNSGEHTMRVSAVVEDGALNADIYTAGERIPLKLPVSKDLLMTGSLGTIMNVPSLKPGKEITVDAFDPMSLSVGKAVIKCIGEETVDAAGERVDTKIVTTTMNGMTSKAWVTNEEEVIRVDTPFGFCMRKILPEEAIAPSAPGDSSNLLKSVAIEPTGQKTFRGAKRLQARMSGVTEATRPPADNIQSVENDLLTITCPPMPEPGTVPANISEDFYGGDTFIQTEHPRVKELAAQIVGNESDTWKRALAVYTWVYENIRKKSTFSIPSALEVMETREGDCNEHTVLYTALARAAHVPTRIAIGIVWSDALNGFYYHAWPEVYIDKWIWMDPTLGQTIADATHIKLLNGNIESWPRLIPYLGQLKLDIVSIE